MNRSVDPRALINPLFAMLVSVVLVLQMSTGGMTNGLASRIASVNILPSIEAELVAIKRTEHANDLKLNSLSLSNWVGSADRQSEFAVGIYGADAWQGPKGITVNGFGPLNEGRLPNELANTLRKGTYDEVIAIEPTTVNRAIGDNGSRTDGCWTCLEPQGPLQSVVDRALDQNWGNSATTVIQTKIPVGTRYFDGFATAQRGLVGGGNQIYFDRNINPIDSSWIQQ